MEEHSKSEEHASTSPTEALQGSDADPASEGVPVKAPHAESTQDSDVKVSGADSGISSDIEASGRVSTKVSVIKDSITESGGGSAVKSDTELNTDTKDDSKKAETSEANSSFNEGHDYELVDGTYFYTDKETKIRYKFVNNEWAKVSDEPSSDGSTYDVNSVTTDEEGRTYYYAGNLYLCRDPTGQVYYMDDATKQWLPWDTGTTEGDNKWYFYKDNESFYRDQTNNDVYKLDKPTNEWKMYKSGKRKRDEQVEEFDTDSDEDQDVKKNKKEEESGAEKADKEKDPLVKSGTAPPGYKEDPNIREEEGGYVKTDPQDGMVYEWEAKRRAWFPKLDDQFMASYQLSYGFHADGTRDLNPVRYDDDEETMEEEEERKREEEAKKKQEKEKQKKKEPEWYNIDDAHNTHVYLSHLPLSYTRDQVVALASKCGLLLKDPDSNDFRVKLYTNPDGSFKGDATCIYIKVESVQLALQMLDDYQVEPGHRIKAERAKYQLKGEYNAKLKPKKRKKKIIEKMAKTQDKLLSWGAEPVKGARSKHDNTVVVKHAFDPQAFEEDPALIDRAKALLRARCVSFGALRKLELFDRHPDGVAKVTFADVVAADLCVASMHGRLLDGRTLDVATWDGRACYKVEETEEQREARLKKWDEFLHTE